MGHKFAIMRNGKLNTKRSGYYLTYEAHSLGILDKVSNVSRLSRRVDGEIEGNVCAATPHRIAPNRSLLIEFPAHSCLRSSHIKLHLLPAPGDLCKQSEAER
jgi:hypothetical protein